MHSFPCTIRSSGAMAAFLGKVGHRLIMELHHLTINHESNLGPAQQKENKHLLSWAPLQMPLPHSFMVHSQFGAISLFCTLEAAPDRYRMQTHGGRYATMTQCEVDRCWCKLSHPRLHQISVIQQWTKNRLHRTTLNPPQ